MLGGDRRADSARGKCGRELTMEKLKVTIWGKKKTDFLFPAYSLFISRLCLLESDSGGKELLHFIIPKERVKGTALKNK